MREPADELHELVDILTTSSLKTEGSQGRNELGEIIIEGG